MGLTDSDAGELVSLYASYKDPVKGMQRLFAEFQKIKPATSQDLLTAEERAHVAHCEHWYGTEGCDVVALLNIIRKRFPKPAPVSPLEALLEEMSNAPEEPRASPASERSYWLGKLVSAIAAEKAGAK